MSRDWKIAAVICSLALMAALAGFVSFMQTKPVQTPPHQRQVRIVAPVAEPVVEPPPAEPSSQVPTLVEAASDDINRREKALASELGHMWTRDPENLVKVVDEASRSASTSPSVTLLLAIAHAETNGKILDVSEAGAVGLAQATPIACRQEKFDGKLYVTDDYLEGARAYIMKKPLGDADTIASLIVTRDDARTRRRAKRLLHSAVELRLEGVNELDLLEPWAPAEFFTSVRNAKLHNLHVLQQLEHLLDHGSRAQIRTFRNHVRDEYRGMKQTQFDAWSRYQRDLAGRRDALLQRRFGMSASEVKKTMAYEAGEYLAIELDQRFSARQMSAFLVQHLERKSEEARVLAHGNDRRVEEMTAALYNGGSHNVKRMLAGLISSLPETQRYMKKVPATRRRLDATIAEAGMVRLTRTVAR
ncbi:MAG TPA: hypothetical protein VF980_09935 [Thermoanaerobaculia bacterium]